MKKQSEVTTQELFNYDNSNRKPGARTEFELLLMQGSTQTPDKRAWWRTMEGAFALMWTSIS